MISLSRSGSFETSTYSLSSLKMEKSGSVSDEKVKVVTKRHSQHISLPERVKEDHRSSSFNIPRHKLAVGSRSKSDGSLTKTPHGKWFHEKVSSLFSRFKRKDEAPQDESSEEGVETEDATTLSDIVFPYEPKFLIVSQPTHSMSFSEEELGPPFRLGELCLDFPEAVHKAILAFGDNEQVKREVFEINNKNSFKILEMRDLIALIEDRKLNSKGTKKRFAEERKLVKAKEALANYIGENGVSMHRGKGTLSDIEQFEILETPHLRVDPFKVTGAIHIVYNCKIQVIDSDHQYIFNKVGSITKDPIGLYILTTTATTLQKS